MTSLSQLLAEELDCDWKQVRTEFAPRRSRLRPAAGNVRQHEHSHLLGPAAQSRRLRARHAAGCRGAEVGRREIAAPHREGYVINTANNERAELRQPRRRRGQAPGARESRAQGSERFSSDRHVAEALGHARKVNGSACVRYRRATSRHGVRGRSAVPGVRRQSSQLRRTQNESRPRRQGCRSDLERRSRDRRQYLDRDGRPARPCKSSVTKARTPISAARKFANCS